MVIYANIVLQHHNSQHGFSFVHVGLRYPADLCPVGKGVLSPPTIGGGPRARMGPSLGARLRQARRQLQQEAAGSQGPSSVVLGDRSGQTRYSTILARSQGRRRWNHEARQRHSYLVEAVTPLTNKAVCQNKPSSSSASFNTGSHCASSVISNGMRCPCGPIGKYGFVLSITPFSISPKKPKKEKKRCHEAKKKKVKREKSSFWGYGQSQFASSLASFNKDAHVRVVTSKGMMYS